MCLFDKYTIGYDNEPQRLYKQSKELRKKDIIKYENKFLTIYFEEHIIHSSSISRLLSINELSSRNIEILNSINYMLKCDAFDNISKKEKEIFKNTLIKEAKELGFNLF